MVESFNIITDNVARELLRISSQNSISDSKLFIKINSVNTFIKDFETEKIEINKEDIYKYKDETSLRDNTIEFDQEYSVDIKSISDNYPLKDLQTTIEFEENDTLAYLLIKEGSTLKYYDRLYDDFIDYIMEQKLRNNILLYLFDVDYENDIKQFIDVIKQIKTITFKEDKKFLIAKGIDSIESVNSEIFMNIEEDNDIGAEDSSGKVDYSDRGFLLTCSEGDQLFEFIKPQQGEFGRTCRGKLIDVEIVNLDAKPVFTVQNSIEIQDSFENIKYLSKKSGYLVKKGNQYDVSNSIDVDEISFKTTGTIDSDLDSEISINVIKNDPLEDAIENGMHVKVQKLSIKGSVGSNTKIEARDISITGQTHNDSSIKCINADIGLHKGKIIARTVNVNRLEGGEIIAEKVVINTATMGKIKAKTIEIETLGSHVTMEASKYIEIQAIKGEENIFILDSVIDTGFDSSKEDDEAYLIVLKEEIQTLLRRLKEITAKIKNSQKVCEKIKLEIIKSKNAGIQIPTPLIEKFKLCKLMRVRYKKIKETIEHKNNQLDSLKKKVFSGASDILDVEISLGQPINGYNRIIYKLHEPERDIELKTDESMRKKVFKLMEDEEGVLKIVNLDKKL